MRLSSHLEPPRLGGRYPHDYMHQEQSCTPITRQLSISITDEHFFLEEVEMQQTIGKQIK
jgi:hypothetical protein